MAPEGSAKLMSLLLEPEPVDAQGYLATFAFLIEFSPLDFCAFKFLKL